MSHIFGEAFPYDGFPVATPVIDKMTTDVIVASSPQRKCDALFLEDNGIIDDNLSEGDKLAGLKSVIRSTGDTFPHIVRLIEAATKVMQGNTPDDIVGSKLMHLGARLGFAATAASITQFETPDSTKLVVSEPKLAAPLIELIRTAPIFDCTNEDVHALSAVEPTSLREACQTSIVADVVLADRIEYLAQSLDFRRVHVVSMVEGAGLGRAIALSQAEMTVSNVYPVTMTATNELGTYWRDRYRT
jgi:hypothetical protein